MSDTQEDGPLAFLVQPGTYMQRQGELRIMPMTKKDYVAIGQALRDSVPTYASVVDSPAMETARTLAETFAKDNPRFTRDRFLRFVETGIDGPSAEEIATARWLKLVHKVPGMWYASDVHVTVDATKLADAMRFLQKRGYTVVESKTSRDPGGIYLRVTKRVA